MDASAWSVGDVLLFHVTGGGSPTISRLQANYFGPQHADWTHAALYVGDGLLIEAVATAPRKVVFSTIKRYGPERPARRLHCASLSSDERDRIARAAMDRRGKPYGFARAVDLGLRLFFGLEPDDAAVRPSADLDAANSALTCSDLVYEAYLIGADITATGGERLIAPASLSASPVFTSSPVTWCRFA